MLPVSFFNRDAQVVAKALLGKSLMHLVQDVWLCCRIIETEAYYKNEKGSHASLGFTQKRKALFMEAGTIYMYYARGGDSLNFSAQGPGNAVLIKSAIVHPDPPDGERMLQIMHQLHPAKNGSRRDPMRMASGQTLLCGCLGLKVPDWDQQKPDASRFFPKDDGYQPQRIIQTTRLGIPAGRDEHLPYRFIDHAYASRCTSNPLTKRGWQDGVDYWILQP